MTAEPLPLVAHQQTFDELGTPLREVTFVVVDLETTGGSAADCEITEIGAVKVRAGEILGELQTLVRPGAPIPSFISVLTGITDAMVATAPPIEAVLLQVVPVHTPAMHAPSTTAAATQFVPSPSPRHTATCSGSTQLPPAGAHAFAVGHVVPSAHVTVSGEKQPASASPSTRALTSTAPS